MIYLKKVKYACDYIIENLENELSLEVISNKAGISKFHFHRIFSSYTGVTLNFYVQLQRMKRASYRLVYNQEMKIIDIAFEAKFDSHEAFSRSFKKIFSVSPTDFRNNPNWEEWHLKYQFNELNISEENMKVDIINFAETKIAALEYKGKPELLNTKIPHFIAWRKETGLSPVYVNRTFGIPYNDPNSCPPDEFRFDICGEITSDISENNYGVIQKIIPEGRCAVIRHLGSRDHLHEPIYYLYRTWLKQSGEEVRDFPLFFQYVNLFPETPENELITNIFLPIK